MTVGAQTPSPTDVIISSVLAEGGVGKQRRITVYTVYLVCLIRLTPIDLPRPFTYATNSENDSRGVTLAAGSLNHNDGHP